MDPDPATFPKPLEEFDNLIKFCPFTHVPKAILKPIMDGLNLEHERQGEILKEKEDKIWALQNQLQAERTEKDQLQRVIENGKAEKKVLREKVDKIAWNQLQAERTEKDQLQREIENGKAEQEVLRAKVDRMVLESNDNKRDVEIQKKLRTSSETRVSMLEKEIKELKEKGKRAASAMMSTAKELEEEGPPSKKIKT